MAATADWNPLGDVFYRKSELYSLEWSVQLNPDKYLIAVAQYAGPIALMRDDRKCEKVPSTRPVVYIYSSSGKEISTIRWNSGHVIALAWSSTEDLLCIQDEGTVLVYDIFGTLKRTFSMGQDAKDVKLIACQVFNSYHGVGIAVLTSTLRLFLVSNVDEPRIRRLAQISGMEKPPTCWAIINQDRNARALMANESELYLLDHGGMYEQQNPPMSCQDCTFLSMSVSFNNKYLALFTDTHLLWIGSSDLQKVYCEFDTKCTARPKQLLWCGTGAIVGYWENILLMVGPQKDWIKYPTDSPVYLVPEVDGLRIIGERTQELLQKVPAVVEDIFRIDSMSPGALLFEAAKHFQRGSERAFEYLRLVKDQLNTAVVQCIEAAGHEWQPSVQKKLLRAAAFGKCSLNDYVPDAFVNMCQMLRVLNAVRDHNIGIPLTYTQLEHLMLPVLLDRLVLRRHYCLAIRLCNFLNIADTDGASRILAHWACYKVQQTHISDEQIATAIAQKLGETPGVSYSEIANRALECDRKRLAIRLLDFEPKAAEQVPLLMRMKNDQLALSKATESGDTDLVYTVLLHLKDTMPSGEFFMAIRTMPVAYSLLLQYYRQQKSRMLMDLYCQEDNYLEQANCNVQDSYDEDRLESRLACLLSAQEAYTKAKLDWAAKQTEDEMKLLRYQRRLEEKLNRSYQDLSLHQTIHRLLVDANPKLAEELRKEFKVPERRFWWLKVNALAEINDWAELERLSKSKKSPIGYEPFLEVCLKHGNQYAAQQYLPRVQPENKVKCHIKAGLLEQAAQVAFEQKNEDDLNFVLSKCGSTNPGVVEKVNTLKSQLAGKR